jgi:prepilin-type N-terminal cleavage/methylation domain-containing protein
MPMKDLALKSHRGKYGLTLVEMLVVLAIIVILTTIVASVVSRISTQSKERLAKSTIEILCTALEQFHDYEYSYSGSYFGFDFPLDCNDFSADVLQSTLRDALGASGVAITGGVHEPSYSGSEALYFFLSKVPQCKKILDRIDRFLVTNEDSDGNRLIVVIDGREYPLFRVVDPWPVKDQKGKLGKALQYDYYNEKVIPPDLTEARCFPVLRSAGPDGKFGTDDDISSK